MGDKRSRRRLATIAAKLAATDEPVTRARLATEVRDLAETIVASSIREARDGGATWREVGSNLGVPFQTLYRRYGTEDSFS
jgi:DNA invertase Pin-like site-specific DNA recombinase